jgi:hypothetical protein
MSDTPNAAGPGHVDRALTPSAPSAPMHPQSTSAQGHPQRVTTLVLRLETVEAGEAVVRYYREPLAAVTRLRRVESAGGQVSALDAAAVTARQALATPPAVPADAWLSLLDSEEDT